MPSRRWTIRLAGAMGLLAIAYMMSTTTTRAEPNQPKGKASASKGDPEVTVARQQARLLHQVYSSTLDSLHHHFFRRDRAVLPARAMEDVFDEVEQQSNIKARWISVNTKAMSVHHEPKSDFEKKAAEAIASGKEDFESVEDGFYNRATAIPLGSSCISCHTGFFSKTPNTPRFAGLVISVPIKKN